LPGSRLVRFNKIADVIGYRQAVHVASGLDFGCYIGGDIVSPMFKSIEGDYTCTGPSKGR
jgi:hypothetical protein